MTFLPISIRHIIGQDLDVIERKALGLPPRKLSKATLTSFEDKWNTRPRAYNRGSIRRVELTTWEHYLMFPYVHYQIDLDMKTNEWTVWTFVDQAGQQLWTNVWSTK